MQLTLSQPRQRPKLNTHEKMATTPNTGIQREARKYIKAWGFQMIVCRENIHFIYGLKSALLQRLIQPILPKPVFLVLLDTKNPDSFRCI